jgi:alpha-glucosidase
MARLLAFAATVATVVAVSSKRDYPSDTPLADCPGYKASNVQTTSSGLTADLTLAGTACDVYGTDLTDLTLEVTYDTGEFTNLLVGEYDCSRNKSRENGHMTFPE